MRGSQGTHGCCDASRWHLLQGAAPHPAHLLQPAPPSRVPPGDVPAGGWEQLLHPWVWEVLNLPCSPCLAKPSELAEPPALPHGVPGDTAVPHSPAEGTVLERKPKQGRRTCCSAVSCPGGAEGERGAQVPRARQTLQGNGSDWVRWVQTGSRAQGRGVPVIAPMEGALEMALHSHGGSLVSHHPGPAPVPPLPVLLPPTPLPALLLLSPSP